MKLINHLTITKFRATSYKLKVISCRKGFTLVELLVGMAIFALLAIVAISFQKLLIQSESFSVQSVFTLQNANAGLRTLITELRSASVADNGAFPLEEALDQQITFYANTDADTDTERVRYFLDGTEFKKSTTEPEGFPVTYPQQNEVVKIIAEFVSNGSDPIFTYYNQDWPSDQINNPLTTPPQLDEVTLVKISLRVNSTPDVAESELILEPAVQIRSLNAHL